MQITKWICFESLRSDPDVGERDRKVEKDLGKSMMETALGDQDSVQGTLHSVEGKQSRQWGSFKVADVCRNLFPFESLFSESSLCQSKFLKCFQNKQTTNLKRAKSET